MPSSTVLFEGQCQENKECWACSKGVTICPETNVTTCPGPDTVSLIKHEIA